MRDAALAYAAEQQPRFVRQLQAFLRIPSISTEAQHRADVARAATWLAADMVRCGLADVAVLPTDGHPVVYGAWLGAGPAAPTLLIYGHYDVQPPGEAADWDRDPFGAEIADGRIHARGASDNKAQHFSHLKAAESYLAATGRLPVNLKFCIDGEEEIGSPHIASFVAAEKTRLAADLLVMSDGAMLGPGRPSIDYALRGIVALDIVLSGQPRALHSGSYGGSVANPLQALVRLLAALHDDDGRVALPGFYHRVRELDAAERDLLARIGYGEAQWLAETGALAPWGEPGYSLLERMTARPTCEINGIWGGYQGEGVRTILPPAAGAKLSLRLVADQDPDEVADLVRAHVARHTPPQLRSEVTVHAGAPAAVTRYDSAAVAAARRSLRAVWGVEPVVSRGGGSLPVVAALQQTLGVDYLLLPLGLDDNRHAPNEYYDLDRFARGIATAIRLYSALAE